MMCVGCKPTTRDRLNCAFDLLDAGRDQQAEEIFIDLVSQEPAAKIGLAEIYRARGDLASALTCDQDVGDADDLATTLYGLGRYDEAAGLWGGVATCNVTWLYDYALALRRAGHETEYLFREVAARAISPLLLENTYLVIAEEVRDDGDFQQADALTAQAEYYAESESESPASSARASFDSRTSSDGSNECDRSCTSWRCKEEAQADPQAED